MLEEGRVRKERQHLSNITAVVLYVLDLPILPG